MVIHLEVDPKKCSYQFLYEIAYFENNPDNLAEIYDTIIKYRLHPSDCDNSTYTDEPDGVFEAITMNKNTPFDVLMKMANNPDNCVRSTVAMYTQVDDIIDFLLDDKETLVLSAALKNENFKRKHFKKIYNRLINHGIDFNLPANRMHISLGMFAKMLAESEFATEGDVVTLGKWLVKNG